MDGRRREAASGLDVLAPVVDRLPG
jgi:hypothetical protein